MNNARLTAILEDINEATSMSELNALSAVNEETEENRGYNLHDEVVEAFVRKYEELGNIPVTTDEKTLVEELASMTRELERIKQVEAVRPVVRAGRKYRLLKDDVSWSTTPQVHALLKILKEIVPVGGEVEESEIVRIVRLNGELLGTRQDPKRIWDYYKGHSDKGMLAHGVLEKV